jgi:hypothetical protein
MADLQGHLKKMAVAAGDEVEYALRLDDDRLPLNPAIGAGVTLRYNGVIHCQHCGRKTSKSYSQGYCYPCSQRLAQCDMCIVRPHTCHFDKGTCREPEWGLSYCYQDHFVYLANSSGLKVGITRQDQLPTRWIDQGATQALPVFRTRSRHIAGVLEKALASHVSDRTDWRKMLKGDAEPLDLAARRDALLETCGEDIDAIAAQFASRHDGAPFDRLDSEPRAFRYPVMHWPDKIRALNLDKTPEVTGRLDGIKGQYLILDSGVLNLRKYTGYDVAFSAG